MKDPYKTTPTLAFAGALLVTTVALGAGIASRQAAKADHADAERKAQNSLKDTHDSAVALAGRTTQIKLQLTLAEHEVASPEVDALNERNEFCKFAVADLNEKLANPKSATASLKQGTQDVLDGCTFKGLAP